MKYLWHDVDLKRGFRDVLIIELDRDAVFTGLLHLVRDIAGAVFAILEVNLCLTGSLDRERQIAGSCFSCPDIELTGLPNHSSLQSRSSGVHPVRTVVFEGTHCELERRSRDVDVLVPDGRPCGHPLLWARMPHRTSSRSCPRRAPSQSGRRVRLLLPACW